MFHKAVTAYEKGHLDELRLIATLVGKQSLPQWDDDETAALIEEEERLDQLIDHVKKDMRRIKSEYPYRMKSILEHRGKLKKQRTELEASIQALEERQQLYQSKVDELLR